MHDEPLPQCIERWKPVDKHLAESPEFRDRSIKNEAKITEVERDVATMKDDIKTIKEALARLQIDFWKGIVSIIATVFLAVAVSITSGIIWAGKYIEKIERLDRQHQIKEIPETRMP